jgi:hypothetical protein
MVVVGPPTLVELMCGALLALRWPAAWPGWRARGPVLYLGFLGGETHAPA